MSLVKTIPISFPKTNVSHSFIHAYSGGREGGGANEKKSRGKREKTEKGEKGGEMEEKTGNLKINVTFDFFDTSITWVREGVQQIST